MNFSVRHIIPGTFQNLKNLEYLYMDSNRIQRIEPSTFYGLNKLKYLGLSKNYLKTLDKVSQFRNAHGMFQWAHTLVVGGSATVMLVTAPCW